MKESIVQENLSGCGIACVAFVLGTSYRNALRLTLTPDNVDFKGFSCAELTSILNRKKEIYAYCYLSKKKMDVLKNEGTIVFIKRSKKHPSGHYLVKTRNGWMDPWFNFPKINPPKAKVVRELPGVPIYAIFKIKQDRQ